MCIRDRSIHLHTNTKAVWYALVLNGLLSGGLISFNLNLDTRCCRIDIDNAELLLILSSKLSLWLIMNSQRYLDRTHMLVFVCVCVFCTFSCTLDCISTVTTDSKATSA